MLVWFLFVSWVLMLMLGIRMRFMNMFMACFGGMGMRVFMLVMMRVNMLMVVGMAMGLLSMFVRVFMLVVMWVIMIVGVLMFSFHDSLLS